ncbi:MAG TPA: class I SAM-dependent methyltransferase [Thioploca sp.]|nr:MAG: hypothetical protein B6247_00635 [Beggiatoa sp. 4572_84]RKZ62863.1 MAG: hypothetical protein DRR08_04900 [Gammaproteobacteria bacterium]HDN26347.1 class I SAM-dependent methyltransferase [Thioploca sp.]
MNKFLSEKEKAIAEEIYKLRKSHLKCESTKEVEVKNAELKKYLHGFESFIDIVKAYLASQVALEGYGYKPLLDIRELPDTRIFITFPLLTETECQDKEKCEVAAACFGLNSLSLKSEKLDLQILVEDNKITHYLDVQKIDKVDVMKILLDFVSLLKRRQPGQKTELLEFVMRIANFLQSQQFGFTYTKERLPKYLPYDPALESNEANLKNIGWLETHFNVSHDVDQGNQRFMKVFIGKKAFKFIDYEDMAFLLDNVPTIEVLEAAIEAGLIGPESKNGFVSIQEERENLKKTEEQYQKKGKFTGENKNLHADWKTAEPQYEYDPVRGFYYLSIEGEPVMDEFEKAYISLLGRNAARFGGAVLEIGFGMGISSNAIQTELKKRYKPADGKRAVHIIIEYNAKVAQVAREWGKRQPVPVIVMEGDWREQIHKIPKEILSGSLSDPYPLNPTEKHKDAALALGEIYKHLRPGGLSVHYSDSQYCLQREQYEIAKQGGFKYFGSATSHFGAHLNTGEYYGKGMRMMIPMLYKEGGTCSPDWQTQKMNAENIQELINKIFIESL